MSTTLLTAHIISHTHWDREWYLNSRYTNEWLVPFFDALFAMLDKEPRYRFVLDGQTSMIEDWLEQLRRHDKDPEPLAARLAQFVRVNQLSVGPYYLQPDWQLVSDEALVRNLLIGREMARALGRVMPVGWLLDNFGQISQAPQIHAQFGLSSLFVWRGIEIAPDQIRSEFAWESPDGSQVTAVYLLASYRNAMRLAAYAHVAQARVRREVDRLAPFARTPNVLLLNGYDQELYPDDILPLLQSGMLNTDSTRVVQSSPEEYAASIAAHRPNLFKLRGALYSGRYIAVFPGVLSSRMYLKRQNDFCQKQLEKHAEPLAALMWSFGQEYPSERLSRAWRLVLKNHPHDSICGVSIDDVHNDMEERFEQASAVAADVIDQSLAVLATNVDTARSGDTLGAWLVVNSMLHERNVLVEIKDDLPADVVFFDGDQQRLAAQRGSHGEWLVKPAIPAFGYATIFAATPPALAEPVPSGAESTAAWVTGELQQPGVLRVDVAGRTIENDVIAVHIRTDGTLDLTDKARGVVYPALAYFEEGGDAGDTYNYSYPKQDQIITSKDQQAEITFLETGPLRASVRIAVELQVPDGLSADRTARLERQRAFAIVTEMTVEADSPLVRFRTHVDNTVTDHRLRVCFPTRIRAETSQAETQFDVVSRRIASPPTDDATIPENVRRLIVGAREPEPISIFPQRTFADLSDGTRGLAVVNKGLPEYEIVGIENTIALTLFRSVGWIARPDLLTRIGDAGPLIATPGAQCLRAMTFEYALLPHAGDWQAGNVLALADEFNSDWLVLRTDSHAGALPVRRGFMQLDGGPLKVTAVKCAEATSSEQDGGALIVRLFNPSDQTIPATLTCAFDIHRAFAVTLAEDSPIPLTVRDGHVVMSTVSPHRIVTLRLEISRRQLPTSEYTPKPVTPRLRRTATVIPVSPSDIAQEEDRAKALEHLLAEKDHTLAEQRARLVSEWSKEMVCLRLEKETVRREYLEARLSALLLKKNSAPSDTQAEFESNIREIGLELNEARVNKRALEYIAAVYE